eukprot:51021-Eustigmatos_ZCMA.PRE.1
MKGREKKTPLHHKSYAGYRALSSVLSFPLLSFLSAQPPMEIFGKHSRQYHARSTPHHTLHCEAYERAS